MAPTADSTLGEWLDHPRGGAIIRDLIAKAGVDEAVLAPALGIPLQQLVLLSQGALPQELLDHLLAETAEPTETAESS